MPEGFRIAPKERVTFCEKVISKSTYLQPFNRELDNIIVLGPIESSTRINVKSILFPSISPIFLFKDIIKYLTLGSLPFFGAANLGRGQLFPTGDTSSNLGGGLSSTGMVCNISLKNAIDFFPDEISDGLNPMILLITK